MKGGIIMAENERGFKGVWISQTVWLDERLNALDKVILTEIDSLDNGERGCYASNKYIADFCQCSETKVSTAISKLIKLGYISVKKFDGRQRELKSSLSNFERQNCKNCKADLQNLKESNINNNINNNIVNIKKERKTSYDEILSGIEESNNTQKQQVAKARSGEEETNALKEKIKCLEKEIEILKNNNNIKERKKEEPKKKATSYDEILSGITDEELKSLYLEYIKMRKLIKAPMTDRALQMLISKVNTLEPDSIDNQKELLETAIMNNWKSVYPIKKGAKDSEQSDYGNNKRNGDEYSFLG